MNSIDSFLKSHDLESELMHDESFVNDSKNLFEAQDLEFSKEQLEEIIGEIDENLQGVRKIPSDKLAQVVGGGIEDLSVNAPVSKATTKKGIAIEASTTILGAILGAAVGYGLGAIKVSTSTISEIQDDNTKKPVYEISTKEHTPGSGVVAGTVAGVAGSALGFQLGQLIVKKYGL